MTPQMIFAILALVQEAITLEPQVATALQSIFSKANPTPEDWAALRLQILGQSYRDYVPASALPAASSPAAIPAAVARPAESNGPINESGASAAATDPQKAIEPPVSAAAAPVQPAPAPATAYKHVITP